jgi:biofilm PGA synthesis protein PgaD
VHARDLVLSAAMWLLYVWLIREAFIDFYLLIEQGGAWLFRHASRPDMPMVFRFLHTLAIYGEVALLNGLLLIAWALYNRHRFGGRDQRKALASLSHADLAARYDCSAEQIALWQDSRSMAISHTTTGKLIAVARGRNAAGSARASAAAAP